MLEDQSILKQEICRWTCFLQRCQRNSLRIIGKDHLRTNVSVLESVDAICIEADVISHDLQWAGYIASIDNPRVY